MFCTNCGSKNENEQKFCGSCGAPFSSNVKDSKPAKPQPQGLNKKRTIIGIGILALLVGVAAVIFVVVRGNSEPDFIGRWRFVAEGWIDGTIHERYTEEIYYEFHSDGTLVQIFPEGESHRFWEIETGDYFTLLPDGSEELVTGDYLRFKNEEGQYISWVWAWEVKDNGSTLHFIELEYWRGALYVDGDVFIFERVRR